MNRELGRVLVRSLLTLAMVLVCSLCLVYQAAEPLRAFSLAITFGLVSAAYTTILIVAPMYYALSLGGMALSARMLARTQSQKDSTPDDDEKDTLRCPNCAANLNELRYIIV